jgi:hypothetical protein
MQTKVNRYVERQAPARLDCADRTISRDNTVSNNARPWVFEALWARDGRGVDAIIAIRAAQSHV